VGGICYIIPLPTGPLLQARGRADVGFRVATLSGAAIIGALLIGAHFGLLGVAIGWLIAFTAMRFYLVWLGLREIGLTAYAYLCNLTAPVLASVIMIACVLGARAAATSPLGPLGRLSVEATAGAMAYGMAVLLLDRNLVTEIGGIARRIRSDG
jgi:O-antigen/teichoic acid export membrane protein